MERLTDERIAEIRAAEEKATPGPWVRHDTYTHHGIATHSPSTRAYLHSGREKRIAYVSKTPDCAFDLDFIALSRTAVPELLAEIERLRADRDRDTTLVACSKCSFGVRARNIVSGMCGECADLEIHRLREWQREAAQKWEEVREEVLSSDGNSRFEPNEVLEILDSLILSEVPGGD